MTPRSTLLPSLAVAGSGLAWGVWWLPLRNLQGAGLAGNWANVAIYALAALLTAPFAVALRRIARGAKIVRFGVPVGIATADIEPGALVHVHNVASQYPDNVEDHYE